MLELFFEHSLAAFVLLDRNFNFIRVNDAYARMCSRDVSEFTGRNHFEMYPSKADGLRPAGDSQSARCRRRSARLR